MNSETKEKESRNETEEWCIHCLILESAIQCHRPHDIDKQALVYVEFPSSTEAVDDNEVRTRFENIDPVCVCVHNI